MNSRLMQCCLAIWLSLGCAFAEGWQTNDVSAGKAVQIASHLWLGMSEEQVVNAVERKNGLRLCLTFEMPRPGGHYLRVYSLRDDCTLQLGFERTNSYLTTASINCKDEKSFSITLTNAPQPRGQPNRSKPGRSETNRPTAAPWVTDLK
jgi:hypothetical protein